MSDSSRSKRPGVARRKAPVSRALLPLIAASALGLVPAAAHSEDPSTPTETPAAAAPDATPAPAAEPDPPPAPALVPPTPSGSDATPVTSEGDPVEEVILEGQLGPAPANGEKRKPDRPTSHGADPAPSAEAQATDSTLVPPNLLSLAGVGSATIGDFDIPPFLLPIYQAAGSAYDIPWPVLAAINRIETDYGRNLNISSAGAQGWMQFMPATWATYGTDANGDGKRDPYNPADAIFSAARYLKAAGGMTDLRKSIFAYNHADWYVADVLKQARLAASLPAAAVDALAGLTEGMFPVHGPASAVQYEGEVDPAIASQRRTARRQTATPDTPDQHSVSIRTPPRARVVAVNDGVIEAVGRSPRLGRFVRLRDVYGNRFTYAHLGTVQKRVPVLREQDSGAHSDHEPTSHSTPPPAGAETDAAPTTPATTDAAPTAPAATDAAPTTPAAAAAPAATTPDTHDDRSSATRSGDKDGSPTSPQAPAAIPPTPTTAPDAAIDVDEARRLAYEAVAGPAPSATGASTGPPPAADGGTTPSADFDVDDYFTIDYDLKAKDVTLKPLTAGRAVVAGTVLGWAPGSSLAGQSNEDETKVSESTPVQTKEAEPLTFEIRPAGKAAPRIDPTPFLNGWRLADATDFFAAQAKTAVATGTGSSSIGQILLMSKPELGRRVLANKNMSIYECGRRDIRAGIVDRRILALLEVLAAKGVQPTVTSLKCGHSIMSASGNVSAHTTGDAVDIATAYGSVITPGTQGPGSITDRAVREILKLQGTMRPSQIITLHTYPGHDNTLAMGDHGDHIHVGYRPDGAPAVAASSATGAMTSEQWKQLSSQLVKIQSPTIRSGPPAKERKPSREATPPTSPDRSR